MLYNLGVQFARANPTAVHLVVDLLFIGCFVALYFLITRFIFGSSSYQNWERNLRYKRLERERINAEKKNQAEWQAAADASMAEWQNNPLPTPDQFAKTLFYQAPLMAEMNEVTFAPQYALRHAYQSAELNPATNSLTQGKWFYHHFEQAAIEALKGYVDALPKQLLTISDESVFTTTVHLDHATLEPAYRALAQPFRDTDFSAFYSFVKEPPWMAKPKRDDYYDDGKFDERKYDRAYKEYLKELDDQWESLTPVQRALWNTPLYPRHANFTEQEITLPFPIPTEQRFAGTWIIAPSGQGKTNLLWHLIGNDRKDGGTVVLMDSKGELLNAYRGYPDVATIEPRTTHINPFQIGNSDQAIDFIEYLFSMIAVGLTGKQKSLFRNVLKLVTNVPDGNITTFRKILTIGWRPLNLEQYIQLCDDNARDFFLLGSPPEFDKPTYTETKTEILWRLSLILSKQLMQDIFTSTTTNVPFFELLDSGKTILINNNTNDLGVAGAEFFGRFFLALTWMAAIRRTDIPDVQKVPVYFYIDEAQTVIANDEKVPIILDECRSQKIALTLAHQRLNRITSTEVKDAMFNCAVRFASVDNDAATIANRFELTADELKLPPHTFACYVRGKTSKAAILKIDFFDKSQFPAPPPIQTPIRPPPTEEQREPPPQSKPVSTPEQPDELPPRSPQPRKKGR